MQYRKEFRAEHKRLLKNGFTETQVEAFYKDIALDVIKDDDKFNAHNLPMYGQGGNNSVNDDDENHGVDDTGLFAYQRGSQRKKSEAEKKDPTGWCSVKICVRPIYTEDNTDIYLESVSIVEQLGDQELIDAIASMTDRRQQILELLVDEWPQKKIAAYLGISGAAVSKHVAAIEKTLEPYFVKNRWIRLI